MASDIQETPFVKQLAANGMYPSRFAILASIDCLVQDNFVRANARIEDRIGSHLPHVYIRIGCLS